MYDLRPNTIIGFHGCELCPQQTCKQPDQIEISSKPYDWLGNGFYFGRIIIQERCNERRIRLAKEN
jgi:hypothetical protein